MIRWIVGWSLKFRFFVVALALATLLVGIVQVRAMPVDALPEFAPPYVEVQTEALGLSASEVEELITLNLEELLNGTPWLDSIRSTSVPGLSSIILYFQPGTDVIRARQLIAERLSLAYTLPNVAKPPVILQPVSATSRVMMVGLSSKTVSPIEMSVLTRWNIRPALLSVPGVANVAIWGMRDRQLQVQVDPAKLAAHNVTLDQIVATTGNALWVSQLSFLNASTPGSGGWIDTPQQRLEVRHILPISTPDDLAQVIVEDTQLRLGDVVTVVEDHQPLIGDDIQSSDAGPLLVIEKFPGANPVDVTRGVEDKLAELEPGLSGIKMDTRIFRQANFVEMALSNFANALLIGLLLLVLALFFLFYHWRAALISLVAIPLSVVAAGLVLALRGTTINVMILAGLVIAIAVLVDDAIVDVENIMRRLRQQRAAGSDRSTASIILEAMQETRGVMLYATLIVLLPLAPIIFLGGVTGAFFQPLALTYALALLTSLMVALTLTPALCLILFAKSPLESYESPPLRWLQRGYYAVIRRIIHIPRPGILASGVIAVGVLALAGLAVLPFLGKPLLPAFKEPDIIVQWEGAPGTSYPEMARITTRVSRELRAIPGVHNVGAHIGRAILGDQIVDVNSAQLAVSVEPGTNYDATVRAVERVVKGYPGLFREVQTYLDERTKQVLTGSSDDIVVRIYGPDLGVLRGKAAEVQHALAQIDGASGVHAELQTEVPQVQVRVKLAEAQRYGLKPGDVRRSAATLVAGIEAGSLFEEQKVFDVVVKGTAPTYSSLTSIREMLIDTPDGGHVRLGDVADVSILPSPNLIRHQTVSRRIDVGLNVRGRDTGAVVREINERLSRITFPLEYRAQVLGEYAERQAAQGRLFAFGLAAAIIVFLLLQAAFGSWRLATLIFFTLPFALVGGVLAAFAIGGVISLAAVLGLLAVFAIAARNGMLLINHYQHLEREEGMTFGPELVMRGARERLGPILITALAASLALAPLAIAGNSPGYEIAFPMAVVILGGLITSTALNLFIVPILYLRFGRGASTPGTAGRWSRFRRREASAPSGPPADAPEMPLSEPAT
ncbi:MAG: CzcABC family efflux RND transporter, transmembrane protein [Ktedonobacterales bacterium]|jgi:CzcA family heavy metal efflux pump|nr:MAG: CzcABC family efflux RND transporter, transmembrane protein [Ktedonobacterales bacterium]